MCHSDTSTDAKFFLTLPPSQDGFKKLRSKQVGKNPKDVFVFQIWVGGTSKFRDQRDNTVVKEFALGLER